MSRRTPRGKTSDTAHIDDLLRNLTPDQHDSDYLKIGIAYAILVTDERDGSARGITTKSVRRAVIVAYAESLGDFNTWNYGHQYRNLVEPCGREGTGEAGWRCGTFVAFWPGAKSFDRALRRLGR